MTENESQLHLVIEERDREIETLRGVIKAQRQTLSQYAETVEDQHAEAVRLQRQIAVGDQLRATHIRERDEALARLSDLTTRLGFGDGVTEPQADNDTIVRSLREREWASEERDEARAKIGAVKALAAEWERTPVEDPTSVPWPVAEALMHKAAADLRAALATPTEARP